MKNTGSGWEPFTLPATGDPYTRAKQAEEDLAARDKKEEAKVRTCIDLIRLANLDEDEVKIGTSLHDLNEAWKNGDSKKKDDNRAKVLARLKEAGVLKLTHRQKLANTFSSCKRDGRLRPVKDEAGAGDEEAEANGAATSQFPRPMTKDEIARVQSMTIAPLPGNVFDGACKGTIGLVSAWLNASDAHNINARDGQFGATMLMGAALGGHEGLVSLLIQRGANLDMQNGMGGTALINAAGEGHTEIVDRLLKEGADAQLKHSRGQTALEFAEQRAHHEAAALLRAKLGLPPAEPPPPGATGGQASAAEAAAAAAAAAKNVFAEVEVKAEAAAAAAVAKLEEGQRVKIIALLARPDLNGRVGKVVAFSAERGRYNVDVGGEIIALRPDNLKPVDPPGAPAAPQLPKQATPAPPQVQSEAPTAVGVGGGAGGGGASTSHKENATEGFVAAGAFDGARPGMVFKMGPAGLGYYPDAAAASSVSIS